MKMLYKQDKVGWCCPLTLANVFQNEGYLEYLKDEKYKGCTSKEVNHMLSENLGKDFSVTTVAEVNIDYGTLPLELVWKIVNKDFTAEIGMHTERLPIIPYFLSVKLLSGINLWHFIAILKINNKLLYVDPYKDNFIELKNIQGMKNKFSEVSLVERLSIKENNINNWAIIFGDKLGYKEFFK